MSHISIQISTEMSKLSKFCLKMYNLQNTAINVIVIKNLLHLSTSRKEVFLRLTISRNPRTLRRKTSTRKCYPRTLQIK